jgi:hypothetical protein
MMVFMKTSKGRWLAIVSGVLAGSVLVGTIAAAWSVPFTVKHDISPLLKVLRDWEGPVMAGNMLATPPERTRDDIRQEIIDFFLEGLDGEEAAIGRLSLRVDDHRDLLVVTGCLASQIEIARILGKSTP